MAYTEFCCKSGGSNLNAGTIVGDSSVPSTSPLLEYASGSWVASTGVFTVASGNPSTDGVVIGQFASIYVNGATTTGFIARVTAVSSTTITVSTTIKAGTAPSDGTGNTTLRIGGAWAGPSGTSGFPFTISLTSLLNTSSNPPRVNFCGTFSITSTITAIAANDITWEGYNTIYGDSGFATLTGPTTGTSFTLLTMVLASNRNTFKKFVFENNGATGTATGILFNGTITSICCIFRNFRGTGVQLSNTGNFLECEAYNCNQSNTGGLGGMFAGNTGISFVNCISHDHSANSYAFRGIGINSFINCIADTSGQGFWIAGSSLLLNCDAYNNTSHGVMVTGPLFDLRIINCNFVKNGGYAIYSVGQVLGHVLNCGFGTGTQANVSGNILSTTIEQSNNINYPADTTPWNNPVSGDFRLISPFAKNAGYGRFLQTQSGYTGAVAYPDIGAGQSSGGGMKKTNYNAGFA